MIRTEILGIAISENKRINGIEILEKEHKIAQYADDTTLLLKQDLSNLNRALGTLKFFHSVSGLKVNIETTNVVQLGVKGDSRMKSIEKNKTKMDTNLCYLV